VSRDISLYIKDILQNMNDAEEFMQGLLYDQFASDKKTLNAVLRSIEVIGEAAKKAPVEIRTKYPSVPWKEMAGVRDKIIHFYFGVDREAVWLVVKERIPSLKPLIEQILRDLSVAQQQLTLVYLLLPFHRRPRIIFTR
jgi:uncharacterized protein with HEPN domain